MNEEIKKIDDIIKELEEVLNLVQKKYKSITNRRVVFSAMIIQKTKDILDAAKYAIKSYNLTIQISLLRLLCDNCLAIEASKLVGVDEYVNMIDEGKRVADIIVDEEAEQNMSDNYLKKLVDKDYKGFGKLYNFACASVHFSKQALSNAYFNANGKINLNLEVGNKKLKNILYSNNKQMIVLSKVIKDMILKLVVIEK
jgi:hypothetical protein